MTPNKYPLAELSSVSHGGAPPRDCIVIGCLNLAGSRKLIGELLQMSHFVIWQTQSRRALGGAARRSAFLECCILYIESSNKISFEFGGAESLGCNN